MVSSLAQWWIDVVVVVFDPGITFKKESTHVHGKKLATFVQSQTLVMVRRYYI